MNLEKTSKSFQFLKEVHQETLFPKQVKLSGIVKKYQFSPKALGILVENKLVTFEGIDKRRRVYKWNTIVPNVKMAEEFYTRYSQAIKIINDRKTVCVSPIKEQTVIDFTPANCVEATELECTKEVVATQKPKRKYTKRTPVATTETVQVTETVKEKRTFSFAWGLIKFNY